MKKILTIAIVLLSLGAHAQKAKTVIHYVSRKTGVSYKVDSIDYNTYKVTRFINNTSKVIYCNRLRYTELAGWYDFNWKNSLAELDRLQKEIDKKSEWVKFD